MIDIDVIRQHLKLDEGDIEDDLLAQYTASAVRTCETYCNRVFYADEAAREAGRDKAWDDLLQARVDRDTARDLAEDDCRLLGIIEDTYNSAVADCLSRTHGVIVDDTIRAAILMTIGHFYRNRQNVVVGANVAQIPMDAERILQPYLWIGDIAGDSYDYR